MFNDEFYPTPEPLARKLAEDFKLWEINTILEPSAGKGDLMHGFLKQFGSRDADRVSVFCCEIEPELCEILKSKRCRVIGSDFLQFNTYQKFDLILMNPPFSDGDKHLLKALKMQENGGHIKCILNAETIKNPYSNSRKELVRLLEEYNAKIEYVENGFNNAERKTNVEVALISVDIPQNQKYKSILVEHLEKARLDEQKQDYQVGTAETALDGRNFFNIIVGRYNAECKNAVTIIDEFAKLQPLVQSSFDKESPIIFLSISCRNELSGYSNRDKVLCEIRRKYWSALFQSQQFSEKMTQDLKSRFLARVNDLIFYEFNEENIKKMYIEMNKQITGGIEEAIIKLFDHFSIKSYWDENSSNVHYFNGWKTNKAYIVNKKVIQRLCGTSYFGERWEVRYETQEVLEDMEKVFDYLNPVKEEHETIRQTVSRYEREKKSTQIVEFYYFKCQFYKKGTCHITFKNENLLKKFNLYGCIHHNWLFDSYGKKPYKEMNAEEQMVVDEFEGEKAYAETYRKAGYYLTDDFGELKMIGIN